MILSDSSSCAPAAEDDWGDDQGMILKVSHSKDGDDWGTILKVSGSKSGGRWGGSQARGECHGVCPENIPTDIDIINRLWLWLAETWIHQLWLMNILATQYIYALVDSLLNHRDGLLSDGLTKIILHKPWPIIQSINTFENWTFLLMAVVPRLLINGIC